MKKTDVSIKFDNLQFLNSLHFDETVVVNSDGNTANIIIDVSLIDKYSALYGAGDAETFDSCTLIIEGKVFKMRIERVAKLENVIVNFQGHVQVFFEPTIYRDFQFGYMVQKTGEFFPI